jgi:hypothetical protein
MKIALVLVWVLLACKSDERAEVKERATAAKERAVVAAEKAADEAKLAMEKAKAEAQQAWQRLEAARAEHAKVSAEHEAAKEKLAEVREQAAETVKIAKQKLLDLGLAGSRLDKRIAEAKQEVASATGEARVKAEAGVTELEAKRDQLTDEIKKLMDMIAEIENAKQP